MTKMLEDRKKGVIGIILAVAVIGLLITVTVYAAKSVAEKSTVGKESQVVIPKNSKEILKEEKIEKTTEPQPVVETENSGKADQEKTYISLKEAKKIAVERAGLSLDEVSFQKAKQDIEDGVVVYELEFYKGNMEYSCDVDAITGAVMDYEQEVEDVHDDDLFD